MSVQYKFDYTLYLVTERQLLGAKDLVTAVKAAIAGGVTMVQLREKTAATGEFYQLACQLQEIAIATRVPLIINDRVDIALAVDAAGLHIGQSDLPLSVARRLLGREKIIGVSVRTVAEAQAAVHDGADYLGVGAVFPTTTKHDADAVSLATLREIKASVSVPIVAIGGINSANLSAVTAAGVDGVAVVSAIMGERDPERSARQLRSIMRLSVEDNSKMTLPR